MADIIPHASMTLLEAHQAAQAAGMHLLTDPDGNVVISPIIPPGWRKVPMVVRITAPDRGRIDLTQQVAA